MCWRKQRCVVKSVVVDVVAERVCVCVCMCVCVLRFGKSEKTKHTGREGEERREANTLGARRDDTC